MIRQALHIRIWQLSTILLISSCLKLCQVGWGQTHIFRFLQKYLIQAQAVAGWVVYKPLLLCDCPIEKWTFCQSGVLNALDWVFIKAISIFWCIELFVYSGESLRPCRWKTAPQEDRIKVCCYSTLYVWDGTLQVMSRAGFLQTWCLELSFIKPGPLVFHSLRVR